MIKENEPITAIHLFLNGGVGIGKTFIAKTIYHVLGCFYNKEIHRHPLKIKVIVVSFIGRVAHIANDIIKPRGALQPSMGEIL